ncbi:hypothetical protein LCGC14_2577630, partial [marine sediment metagenome]
MFEHVEAFPLSWPAGWPRTKRPRRASYTVGFSVALEHLLNELRLLGGRGVIVSSNVPVRQDNGMPLAASAKRRVGDAGVAVYFICKKESQVIACDKWDLPYHNIRAVGLTVGALQMIDRAGASELLDRAFTGFKALPPSSGIVTGVAIETPRWWEVFGFTHDGPPPSEVKKRYRDLAAKNHPDNGGDPGAMARINEA